MKSLLFGLICLLISALAYGDTLVSGDVEGEWTREGNPYIVTGTIFLRAGDTLTIRPGVIVKFQADRAFSVSGHLECLGEAGDSVYFTGDNDNVEDMWLGLNFYSTNGDTSVVRYAVIEYAGSYNGALHVQTPYLIFEHNTIRNCFGRGLKVLSETIEIQDCAIVNNRGGSCGGGIMTQQSDVTFRRCLIAGNSAQDGGGSCSFTGSITFDSCTFSGNSGSIWAGAIFADSVNVTLTNCVFDSNYATNGGVGWIVSDSRARIDRCVFKGNFAIRSDGQTGEHGGLLMSAPGPQRVTNCLFMGNRGNYGSALHVTGNSWIFNCAFVGNISLPAIDGDVDTLRHCSFDNRNFRNEAHGPQGFGIRSTVNVNGDSVDNFGNLYALPNFDPMGPYGEYSLHHTSNWINAGDPNLAHDADGTISDIGPYPFYRLQRIDDAVIERINNTDNLRLRWTTVPEAIEYWVFSTTGGVFNMRSSEFIGSTPSDEFVHLDALAEPLDNRTYVVIASQVPSEIAMPLLRRQ